MTIDADDPKLTAYALGELGENERAEIAAQIAKSPELGRAVDEIRKTTELVTKELQSEPLLGLTADQRQTIEAKVAKLDGKLSAAPRGLVARYWGPTALAASIVAAVGVGYVSLTHLSRAREVTRLVTSANVKGIGTSGAIYGSRSPEPSPETGWFMSVSSEHTPVPGGTEWNLFSTPSDQTAFLQVLAASKGPFVGGVPLGDDEFGGGNWLIGGNLGEFGPEGAGTEAYAPIVENPFLLVEANPLSTFSIDVDTASYANVRRMLNYGQLPPPDAVRIEELVNYFNYDYPQPTGGDPFSVNIEIADCPWNTDHRLARIGIKGVELTPEERPPANLVFLIDVSGSMQSANKLPLLKEAMTMLVTELGPDDSVAMVVYAGASGLVLPPTMCDDKGTIFSALSNLRAGGSTNGGAGIQLAYDTAVAEFLEGGVNRVILATDGDFNVGVTSRGDLHRLIEERAKSGVFLSVLGFGMGNLNDATLETLADKGNGNYAYIDTRNEARKVLVDQLTGTLVTIAKDVKIQVEFNPLEVAAYRLIGYENRILAAQDFNDDTKDAGEIGAGHTVTALYEIVPAGEPVDLPDVDPLKYQTPTEVAPEADSGELMTVKLRYKAPDGDTSKLIEVPVVDTGATFAESSDDFALAASVASFGMLLRGSQYTGDFTFEAVAETADGAIGDDSFGYRAEFAELVERAIALQPKLSPE